MKILIDMNLSPDWVKKFIDSGLSATHWSRVGSPQAKDYEIMEYALTKASRLWIKNPKSDSPRNFS